MQAQRVHRDLRRDGVDRIKPRTSPAGTLGAALPRRPEPASLADEIVRLQAAAGNRAVAALLIGQGAPRRRSSPGSPPAGEHAAANAHRRSWSPSVQRVGPIAALRGAVAAALATVHGVLTPQDTFAGRSTTRFGVGERVDLSFTSSPRFSASTFGGLRWVTESGTGHLSTALDGTGTFRCDEVPGARTLALQVVRGPRAGTVLARQSFTVVAPSFGVMTQIPGIGVSHVQGKASVGFKGDMWMRPTDVSFRWIEQREGACAAAATGSFSHWNGLPHSVSAAWKTIGAGSAANGCKVNQVDTVHSGELDPPFAPGTFDWPIPWEWRLGASAPTQYRIATHFASCDGAGTTTIWKAGSPSFTRRAADPTSGY